VLAPDGSLYGMTVSGGAYNKGTVYRIFPNRSSTTLADANGAAPGTGLVDPKDVVDSHSGSSAAPGTGLVDPKDVVDSHSGSSAAPGTGQVDPKDLVNSYGGNGAEPGTRPLFQTLVNFNGANGADPGSGLLLDPGGNIYGTTTQGGPSGQGTIFKVTPEDELVTMATFSGPNGSGPERLTRGQDGAFYGTTGKGGAYGKGLVFKFTVDGNLTTLVTFNGDNGADPVHGLSLAQDGNFVGATYSGGKHDLGTVFKVKPDGTLTTLYSFGGPDGSHPVSRLVEWNNGYFYMGSLWDNILIQSARVQWEGDSFTGTTSSGGAYGNGTVFKVDEDGTLATLVSFTGSGGVNVGMTPDSLIAGEDGNLYGTTAYGGEQGEGTVFRLMLQLWIPPAAGFSDGRGVANLNLAHPSIVSP
jgi:uncharacterized repeat protein (TIGR03803 family)